MMYEHFDEAGRIVKITQDDFGDPDSPLWNRGDTDTCNLHGVQEIMPSRVLPGNAFVDARIDWIMLCGCSVYGGISTEWLLANVDNPAIVTPFMDSGDVNRG